MMEVVSQKWETFLGRNSKDEGKGKTLPLSANGEKHSSGCYREVS